MKKIYQKLTDEQKKRGVIFSSTLSEHTIEQPGDLVHEVFGDMDKLEQDRRIKNQLDDSFFDESPFRFNIIRR